jgi:hypothetical protein
MGSLSFFMAAALGFIVFLGVVSGLVAAIFFGISASGVITSGFSEIDCISSESSVLIERFFTLNGLGVVVE